MPEYREHYAAAKVANAFYLDHYDFTSWTDKGLHADACKKERGTSLHAQGFVDQIDATCSWMQGCKDAQSYLWPEFW
jgi:hypothetical protein